MPHSPLKAHVRLDTHPAHPSAVTASLTGTHHRTAQATQALNAEGITTEITPSLLEAITEEWTWANYPMPWCTRTEIREVSNEAQKIYDDIRHGRLIIHAHAEDGWTTVAVGTYRDSGKSVYLHGENHLRQIADTFDSPTQAIAAFERAHGDALRPGPAPMTDTERQTAQARASLGSPGTTPAPAAPPVESVPAYAADPGDHETLLAAFLTENGDWEKYRTWDDNTTVANHESLTLRALFEHDAEARDTKWTIAAYETPVSERMWHMTIAAATPAPILNTLLTVLAAGDAWETAVGSPSIEKTVTEATRPLTDAGWAHTVDGRWLRWQTNQNDAGVQFDAFAAQTPNSTLSTWTIWAGPSIDHPAWAIHASAYTPASLLAHLAEELAHGTGTRRSSPPHSTQRTSRITATPPPAVPRSALTAGPQR